MKDELLWSLIGGVTATVFNVLYNYIRETRDRRWRIAAEICGEMDFYYQRLVTAVAHLESVFDDKTDALSAEEWRRVQTETSPLFIDEQRIRAEVEIVYGVDSYESNQFQAVFGLLKKHLSSAFSIRNENKWNVNKLSLKGGINQIADMRPVYRKKLVEKARLWPILNPRAR